ncbi:MAG: helix-turn-helix domain-containing protein [Candidatus Freyarchaeum deiterrae]
MRIYKCPISTALEYIGKKWTFEIVRDLFFGKIHFNEFLESNPNLSGKVLSERLKELRDDGIIEKKVSNTFPVSVEYELTPKGRALNKILYELAVFAMNFCEEFNEAKKDNSSCVLVLDTLKKALNIQE